MKVRKRPVVVDAVPWTGANHDEIRAFCPVARFEYIPGVCLLVIPTPEGGMQADEGDWIIRGVKGEFYPIAAKIFCATYKPVGVTYWWHGDMFNRFRTVHVQVRDQRAIPRSKIEIS